MVQVGEVVDRLDLALGAADVGLGVARLVADEGLLGVEPGLQELGDRGARHLGGLAGIPHDRQRFDRLVGMPVAVGDDGDAGIADLHHLLHAWHAGHLGGIEALDLTGGNRTVLDGGDEHAGQLEVDAVDLLAGQLVEGVEALDALARDLPVLRVLELDVLGRLELGRGLGDLAEGGGAAGRLVGDHAVGRAAFGGRHFPLVGRGLDQHLACRCATLADIFVGGADAAAAAGGHVAPHALAREVLAGGRKFRGHLRPVAFEFLGDQLGKPGERALAHLGTGDAHHDGVVGADHDPGIDFGGAVGGTHDVGPERNPQAEGEAAAERGGADHEGTAIDVGNVIHGGPPHAFAAA